MALTPLPPDEEERLEDLYQLHLLDTPPEERFDFLTGLLKELFHMPMAAISLIDKDRQWFKARIGMKEPETPRNISFCAHTILGPEALVIPDAQQDPRVADNPLVTGMMAIRFYAGFPLQGPGHHNIGALCVIDTKPHTPSGHQLWLLKKLAHLVEQEMRHKKQSHRQEVFLAATSYLAASSTNKRNKDDFAYRETIHNMTLH